MQSPSTSKKTDQLEFDFRSQYDKEMDIHIKRMSEEIQKEIDAEILKSLISLSKSAKL